MPDQIKPKGRLPYPFTTIALVACVVFWLISIPVSWRIADAKVEQGRPDLALNSFVRALREYRDRRAKWPERLPQLVEAKVWEVAGEVSYGEDGRNMQMGNYYYKYFLLEGDVVSVWAVPVGEYAQLGSTHFVLVGRGKMRHWMGGPLRREDLKYVISFPSDEQFALMSLREQREGKAATKRRGFMSLFE